MTAAQPFSDGSIHFMQCHSGQARPAFLLVPAWDRHNPCQSLSETSQSSFYPITLWRAREPFIKQRSKLTKPSISHLGLSRRVRMLAVPRHTGGIKPGVLIDQRYP